MDHRRFFATVKISGLLQKVQDKDLAAVENFLHTFHRRAFSVRRIDNDIPQTMAEGYSVEEQYGPLLVRSDAEHIHDKCKLSFIRMAQNNNYCAVTFRGMNVWAITADALKDKARLISGLPDGTPLVKSNKTINICFKFQPSKKPKTRNTGIRIETRIDAVRPNMSSEDKLRTKLGKRNQGMIREDY